MLILCLDSPPFFRRDITHVLRKRPPVPRVILSRVLPFTKGHIVRRLDNVRTTLSGVFEMPVDVCHGDVNVLGDWILLRSTERAPLSTEHDCAFRNSQLRMTDQAISFGTETL